MLTFLSTSSLELAQQTLDDALLDSFNTPTAMSAIEDLISRSNIYLSTIAKLPSPSASLSQLAEVARWITRILRIFGLDASSEDSIGWSNSTSTSSTPSSTATSETMAFARGVSAYRDAVRTTALTLPQPQKSTLLSLSDTIRDVEFVNLGISLDDRPPPQPALLKSVPKAELLAARAKKEQEQQEAEKKKAAAKLEREKAEQLRLEKGKLAPEDMFRGDAYSAWDAEGLPTREKDGTEVNKSKSKKLKKEWERQKKLHEAYSAGQKGGEQASG